MNTNIEYRGEVTFSTLTRTQRRNNDGTRNLFRLLTKMLAGEVVDSKTLLPRYVALYSGTVSDITSNPTTSSHSSLLGAGYLSVLGQSVVPTMVGEDTFYRTRFQVVIDTTAINSPESIPTNVSLALVAGNKEDILAVVDFPMNDYQVVCNGGLATITWELQIANKGDL